MIFALLLAKKHSVTLDLIKKREQKDYFPFISLLNMMAWSCWLLSVVSSPTSFVSIYYKLMFELNGESMMNWKYFCLCRSLRKIVNCEKHYACNKEYLRASALWFCTHFYTQTAIISWLLHTFNISLAFSRISSVKSMKYCTFFHYQN